MTDDPLDHLHELHGHAMLKARKADTEKERFRRLVQAEAFGYAIQVCEDGWEPFEDTELLPHFRDVSEAVVEAGRVNYELNDRRTSRPGLE